MASLERDGQTIGYTDHGGDGPPVVVLHSFAMDGRMFAPQVADLGAAYRVVAVDERGHGTSPTPVPDAAFTYDDVADDVLAVLDELGIERAAVVGTSQGGFVALRMALRAPRRVTALVLLGTSAAAEDPDVVTLYASLAEGLRTQGATDELVGTMAAICLGAYAETPAGAEWTTRWRAADPQALARNVGVLTAREGLLDRLGEVDVPALVLHGDADAAYPVAKAEQVVAGLPRAEPLVVVPGGSHFLSLTHAVDVDPVVRAFLDRHHG